MQKYGRDEVSENYIEKIVLGAKDERGKTIKKSFQVAYPKKEGRQGAITVICGRNNSGKSHILRKIVAALECNIDKNENSDKLKYQGDNITVEFLKSEVKFSGKVLHLHDLTRGKINYENFSLKNNREDPKGKTPKYKAAIINFLGSQFLDHFKEPNFEQWDQNAQYRINYIEENLELYKLYLCDQENSIVCHFQKAVSGLLYFAKTKTKDNQNIDFWIYYDDSRIFRYGNWSDGQKTLFTCLLQLDYSKPDILLIDEIENHFHPEYITQLCSVLREKVKQTIIVSHHPHVLFSNYVDQLVYIEIIDRSEQEPKKQIIMPEKFTSRSPRREISMLTTDFEKITSAYGLFDRQDDQLLQLAGFMDNVIDHEFVEVLSKFIKPEVAEAKKNIRQDSQAIQLTKAITPSSTSILRFLDFGAGNGRMFKEFMKKPLSEVEWDFWEPNKELQKYLLEVASSYQDTITKVITSEQEIKKNYYDFSVLANILHELTPLDIAKTLATIESSLKENGKIIILELYPLIKPEKYAIPYSRQTLTKILIELGWKCQSDKMQVTTKNIEAYSIRAHSPNPDIVHEIEKNANKIRKIWNEDIMPEMLNEYDGTEKISSMNDLIKFMNEFATIMSILNEKRHLWKPSNID
jgi:ABC-type cobalamin/Fe3+-siderophores transport system ATPase subunit